MNKYIVRSRFTAKSPDGEKIMKRGEAFSLSSVRAATLVSTGFIVDAAVGLNLLSKYETRMNILGGRLGYPPEKAQIEATQMVVSCLKRHESLKSSKPPSPGFVAEVKRFNVDTKGRPRPIGKEKSDTGVGEWAGYKCNIGKGCAHGCLYCYAERMAVQYQRVQNADEWQVETLKEVSTAGCKRYGRTIMFPTSHDITPAYLAAYKCHLFNMLKGGNEVLVVTKPHRECIEAIGSEFTSYRDHITFRFTIGSLEQETMQHWEPGAPPVTERIDCLKLAFEMGYTTSVSAEPMLGGKEDAVKLYHLLEPYITHEIWFGKMNTIGGLKGSQVPEVAQKAKELTALQNDTEILDLVVSLGGLPKVQWKDSIKKIIVKNKEKI